MLFAPLLDLYFGQKTTIALWLCLHLFLHLRQRLLYVLLPVSEFMKKSHSCFAFFDNLGIVKTPFTCLNRERFFWGCFLKNLYFLIFTSLLIWTSGIKMHTHFLDLQNIFIYPHLFELIKAFCTPCKAKKSKK